MKCNISSVQAKINSNPPTGVIGPRKFNWSPEIGLVANRYIETEKSKTPNTTK